jgi:hypothetical protein
MKRLRVSLVGLVLVGLLESSCGPLGTPLTPLGRACHTNADCRTPELCRKAWGDCEGTGRCHERPRLIGADLFIVCGCEGHTYSSPLLAASRGITIAHGGECEGEPWQPERR